MGFKMRIFFGALLAQMAPLIVEGKGLVGVGLEYQQF